MVVFGLDFGTTFSTVSVLVGRDACLLLQCGSAYIPTTLFFPESTTNVYYGYDADFMHRSKAKGAYFRDLKRWVGCNSSNIGDYRAKLHPSYEVDLRNVGDSEMHTVALTPYNGGKAWYPLPDLIGLYVKCILSDAEKAFQTQCSGVICSVPAGYNSVQRAFTEQSVSRGGYPCVYMLNEPSAAALSSLPRLKPEDHRLLVYDFGGGTFDVSAVTVNGTTFVVKGSGGDMNLGGRDIDRALSDHLKSLVSAPVDWEIDVTSLKEALCSQPDSIMYNIPIQGNHEVKVELRSSDLLKISQPFVARTIKILQDVMVKAKFVNEPSKVVVVGGSSKLPGLEGSLLSIKGVSAVVPLPDHRAAVSLGCALYSNCLSDSHSLLMVDCATKSISIPRYDGASIVVIPAGSPIPFDGERTIGMMGCSKTAHYNARLFEGDYNLCAYNDLIYSAEVPISSLGVQSATPISVNLVLTTKIDSVGKISFSIKGPSGVSVPVQGRAHYDFSTLPPLKSVVVRLSSTDKDLASLVLALTQEIEARNDLHQYLDKLNSAIVTPSLSLEDHGKAGTFPTLTNGRVAKSRACMGKVIPKLLRGTNVLVLPLQDHQ
uniref:Heat shock protein 70-like protein n=1 Tax=Raspberry leaf mottle virus TaxID=326941 RepID=A3R4A4_9CLOS|nr:heat shock protein 70-like protein [Raspberry leaf mottle virus]